MNLSVVIVPAKVLADGTHKVRIAISHNSETRYKVTRFIVPSPKNVKNGRVVGKDISNAEYINLQLNSIVQRMYRAYDSIPDAECYSCSEILKIIESKLNNVKPTTFEQISNEWLSMKETKCKEDSVKIFKKAVDCFLEFVGKGFLLALLNPNIVTDYEEHLVKSNSHKRNGEELKTKLSPSTINMRMRVLRQIVSYAEKHKYVSFDIDPFVNFSEHKENIRDLFLSVEELRRIRDFKSDDENAMFARDLFMLSFYLCGMNLEDILTIDFRSNSVSFIRRKTESRRLDNLKTEFTIQPEAREIIDKYIMYNGRLRFMGRVKKHTISNYFERHFPKVSQSKHIIFYSARKTFAQLAYILKVQEMVIRFCIGDALTSKEKDMLRYYTKTEKRMADEAIRKVFDFVAGTQSEDDLFNKVADGVEN